MKIITVGVNIRYNGDHVGWIMPTIVGEMFAEELERLSHIEEYHAQNKNEELEATRELLNNADKKLQHIDSVLQKLQYKVEYMYSEGSISINDSEEILELIEEKDNY